MQRYWSSYTLAHFADRRIIEPLFVQSVFGILDAKDILMMKRAADRLFRSDHHWSVLGAGRNQMKVAAIAAAIGGHIRVGLEDSLWSGPGKLATSSAEQVRIARTIIEGVGRTGATPDEARGRAQCTDAERMRRLDCEMREANRIVRFTTATLRGEQL
ncbi:uncharacterized protein (DUF849 family) [Bradyrhizobium sp. GM2.4]